VNEGPLNAPIQPVRGEEPFPLPPGGVREGR
jgi:hypothetical protein